MDSLVNLQPLADVVNNLMDKLEKATGWIMTRQTPQRVAEITYIREIENSDYDPLTKAALISSTKKTIREYCNQYDVVNIALHLCKGNAKPEHIDEDWVVRFMDRVRLVSSDELKLIWGNVLAKECNEPGTIPPILIDILGGMDREDAEAFAAICRTVVRIEDDDVGNYPIIVLDRMEEYKQYGVTLNSLVDLKALGLIEMSYGGPGEGYIAGDDGVAKIVSYYDDKFGTLKQLPVGNVVFTKPGNALFGVIEVEKIENFWGEHCAPMWERNGCM